MYVFVRSPIGILVSGIVTIAIAAFIYFVIVKPETDRAHDTADKALKQAQPTYDRAQRIQNCIAKAGGDPEKIAACQ
jgi:hypothetical protein